MKTVKIFKYWTLICTVCCACEYRKYQYEKFLVETSKTELLIIHFLLFICT